MKKILLTLIISISMTMSANAACEHGTLSDDGRFCISNITLNWLSAANWCKANGRHLASIYEVCPDWDGNKGSRKCLTTLNYIGTVFTSTVSDSDSVFCIFPGANGTSGLVTTCARNSKNSAMCK